MIFPGLWKSRANTWCTYIHVDRCLEIIQEVVKAVHSELPFMWKEVESTRLLNRVWGHGQATSQNKNDKLTSKSYTNFSAQSLNNKKAK